MQNQRNSLKKIAQLVMIILCITSLSTLTVNAEETDNNRYIDQFIQNNQNPFALYNSDNEYISPFIGNLGISETDLSLKGKNGLDFTLTRNYNSGESSLFDLTRDSVIEDNPNEIFYDIGSGWSFDIPYVRYIGYNAYLDRGLWEINYGASGSDIVTHFGNRDTKSGTTFKNDKNENKQFYFAIDEFTSGQYNSVVMLEYQNGLKMYFAEEGMLLGQVDRYGNTIRYEYEEVTLPREEGNGLSLPRTRYRLKRVIDTLGRNIYFQYNTNSVTVSVTDNGKTKQIVYGFTKVTDLTSLRPENYEGLVDYTDKVLSSVTNPAGERTTYTYKFDRGRKNYYGKSVDGQENIYMYALLEEITYPGGTKSNYEYQKSIRNLGFIGGYEFFKISKRYDKVFLGDGTSRIENETNYNYSFDKSSEFDGYPLYGFDMDTFSYRNFPDDFKIRVSVTNNLGTTEYVADKELSVQEIIRTTASTKSIEERKYDGNHRIIKKIIKDYASTSSDIYQESVTHYQLDNYGRTTATWNPLTPIDSGYNVLNDEYKVTYTYDNRFGHLLSKKFKQNQNTTIEERYTLTSDGKSIAAKEIYSNNSRKEKQSYTYDNYGNITTEKKYKDDFSNYIETIINYGATGRNAYPTSATVKNVHDVNGNLIGDVTTSTEYDGFGNVIASIDADGNRTQYELDILDRQIKTTYPNGTTTHNNFTILPKGFKTTETNQQDNNFSIYYDSLGRLSKVTDDKTNNILSKKTYNDNGRVEASYDAKGNRTEYLYHPDGTVKEEKVIDTSNNVLSHKKHTINHAYEFQDNKYLYIVDEVIGDTSDQNYYSYTYLDKMGRVEKKGHVVDGHVYIDKIAYDYVGNSIKYTDHINKVVWTKEYDYANRVIKQTNTNNDYMTLTYNSLGQKIQAKDYKANDSSTDYSTIFRYDELGKVLEVETPFEIKDGVVNYQIHKNIYDKLGRLVEQRDNNNKSGESLTWKKQFFTYDDANHLTLVKLIHDNQPAIYTQYYYDELGNTLRKYTGLSSPLTINGLDDVTGSDTDYSVTKYNYDHLGNQINFVDPLGQGESYNYDINGNIINRTDRNGTTFTYNYDGLNRIIETNGSNNKTNLAYRKTNHYMLNGDMDYVTENGNTTNFTYDDAGHVRESINGNITKTYRYNTNGNRSSFNVTVGNQNIIDVDYNYDKLERLTEVIDNGTKEAEYTYDVNGNRKTIRYGNQELGADYDYNLSNKIKTITNINSINNDADSVLPNFTYNYQLDGNIVDAEDSYRNVVLSYNYDDLNRLINESKVNNGSIPTQQPTDTGDIAILNDYSVDYTFDDYGNIKTKQNNGVTTTYTYDKNCRVLTETINESNKTTKKIYTYDPNGNQLSVTTETYTTNDNPTDKYQLVITGQESGASAEVTFNTYNLLNQLIKVYNKDKTAKYTYDHDGLRIKKEVNNEITKFIYDGSNMVAELNNDDTVIATYLYGTSLILQKDNNNNKHYYFFNAHADVVAITDTQGNVEKRYEYNAYGEDYTSGNAVRNPLKYFGQYYDEETGTYYLRARYYNPVLNRFITEDSYLGNPNDPLSLNLYIYCHNNPIMFVDPSGHTDFTADLFFYEVTEEAVIGTGSKNIPLVGWAIWLFNKFSIDAGETNEQIAQITKVENKKEPYIFVLQQSDGSYILTDFEEINEPFSTEGISIIEKESYIFTTPLDTQETLKIFYAIQKSKFDPNAGALDQLGKELEKDYTRNGNLITQEEAEIIDEWAEEYDVPQHHGVMEGSGEHWVTGQDHTHIRNKHIPYE
ncbi:RHS repeat domain-containing protein [Vallitalea guaymasensis]|uniref:RHS repeat domain-containing protein n=1 Tax=Vallitalea guaymasensis TaxID=1185412 RepID=UPI000DE47923|nr:RHS repeat-associated core domain-containing protein [Vallitalea guaymasensis]